MPEPDVGASARLPLLGRGRDGEFHGDKAKVVCGIPSLPETSSSHLKTWMVWERILSFWEIFAYFQGLFLAVCFREGNMGPRPFVPKRHSKVFRHQPAHVTTPTVTRYIGITSSALPVNGASLCIHISKGPKELMMLPSVVGGTSQLGSHFLMGMVYLCGYLPIYSPIYLR